MFIEKIDKDDLLKPLQAVVGIVERKQPLPILSNVLIEKTGRTCRFVATDLGNSNYARKSMMRIRRRQMRQLPLPQKNCRKFCGLFRKDSKVIAGYPGQSPSGQSKQKPLQFANPCLHRIFPKLRNNWIKPKQFRLNRNVLKKAVGHRFNMPWHNKIFVII